MTEFVASNEYRAKNNMPLKYPVASDYWQQHVQYQSPSHKKNFLQYAIKNYGGAYDFNYYLTGQRDKRLQDPGTVKDENGVPVYWKVKNQYDYGAGNTLYASPDIDPYKADPKEIDAMDKYLKSVGYGAFNDIKYNQIYNDILYPGEYTNSPEDVKARAQGLKPWKYQVTDSITQALQDFFKNNPAPSVEEFKKFIDSNKNMSDLAKYAADNQDKGGNYSFSGTPASQYKDIDVEGLKQIGYDPENGWQTLYNEIAGESTRRTIISNAQNALVNALMTKIRGNTANAEQYVDEYTKEIKAIGADINQVKAWAKDYANQYARAAFVGSERQTAAEQSINNRYNESYDNLLTEYAREKYAESPYYGGTEEPISLTKDRLGEGYTVSRINQYGLPLYGVKPGGTVDSEGQEITREEFDDNIEQWETALGLSPEEKKDLQDKAIRQALGIGPDDTRPFIKTLDDTDLMDVSPQLRNNFIEFMFLSTKKKTLDLSADEERKVNELGYAIVNELKDQRPKYQQKYGHDMPPLSDAASWMAINPYMNNTITAFGHSATNSFSLGLLGMVERAVSPVAWEGISRANATHPVAEFTGNFAGNAALMYATGGLGAGAFLGKVAPTLKFVSPVLYSGLEGSLSFAIQNGITTVIHGVSEGREAGDVALETAKEMLKGGGEGFLWGTAFGALFPNKYFSKSLGKKVMFRELPAAEQEALLAGELMKAGKNPQIRSAVTEEYIKQRPAEMHASTPKESPRAKPSNESPKANTDLHSVPNGTVFDMAGSKWVKTTSDMTKTGKPILTTINGEFQIIKNGDTFTVGRLAESKTGYVAIGEAKSLTQAEKMAGDAAEGMRVKTGGAAASKGTGTAGIVGGKGTAGVEGSAVKGRSVEGGSAGKAEQPAAVEAGKTVEGATAGKGTEAGDGGFSEGLIGEEGKGGGKASDEFTEGLLGKEGKAGGEGEYNKLKSSGGDQSWRTKRPSECSAEEELLRDASVKKYYERVGNNEFDISNIAMNTTFDIKDVKAIKKHLFFNTHLFKDGTIRKFDVDYAWYQALVEKAMSEGKTVPDFVRKQTVFMEGIPGSAAGPRHH
jgi:hypothetical protein